MPKSAEGFTDEILHWFRQEYTRTGKAPSVRAVKKKFGLDNKNFYKRFPKGKMQLCKLANVPIPTHDFKRVEKAAMASKHKREEAKKKLEKDPLVKLETKFSTQVQNIKAEHQQRKRLRKVAMDLASTFEGRKQIFNDGESLLSWYKVILESDLHFGDYDDASDLKRYLEFFETYCARNNLSVAQTFLEAVGPQDIYECDRETDPDLKYHISFQLQVYLDEREEQEKQELEQKRQELEERQEEERIRARQKEWRDSLILTRCPNCNRGIHEMKGNRYSRHSLSLRREICFEMY